ncbi:MAG: hypothetical protein ACLRUR_07625 [Butyricicoccus pullicaecorum]
MTITFGMRNVTSESVKAVMLRKFFQMTFVGNNRKSLDIYTAVVGSDESKSLNADRFISRLDAKKEFCMRFDFIVNGNDDNEVLSIISEDVTDVGENVSSRDSRSFLSQVDCIKKVWGQQCEVLYNDQQALRKIYEDPNKLGDCLDNVENSLSELACLSQKRMLWIEDAKKKQSGGMKALTIPGAFLTEDYHRPPRNSEESRNKRHPDEGSEKAFYRVFVPQDIKLCPGIELVSWVKTTIRFKYRLTDQNLIFNLKKDENEGITYIAPDFTWYFSPPVKSFINYESSSVEATWTPRDIIEPTCEKQDKCTCPIKVEASRPLPSTRYDNAINPVANKTTVNFRRWTEDEMIGYRQKYRIASKNIFFSPDKFNKLDELNIIIDTTDEHNRGNRQYVLGIFISFALAFGIDRSRLEDAKDFFPLSNLFVPDTWWMFFIILFSLNMLIRPPKSVYVRRHIIWRRLNTIFSVSWIVIVFCLSQSQLICDGLNQVVAFPFMNWVDSWLCFDVNYWWIPQFIFFAIFTSNFIYVARNIAKYHDPILSGWFSGEDIL